MATRFVPIDRDTPLLLPPNLRDWVPADHLVHFLLDAVEALDLRQVKVNTRGEVEYATRLARANRWTSMLMVPERDQATRARMLFRRCSDMPLVVVPVSAHGTTLLFSIAYEWASLAKAFVVHTSC